MSLTVTPGADGIVLGADVLLPAALVHPLAAVCVTVYVAAEKDVIEVVLALVLQCKVPAKLPAVNVELPQLSTTLIEGAEGTVFVDAVLLPGALVHPFAVVCEIV